MDGRVYRHAARSLQRTPDCALRLQYSCTEEIVMTSPLPTPQEPTEEELRVAKAFMEEWPHYDLDYGCYITQSPARYFIIDDRLPPGEYAAGPFERREEALFALSLIGARAAIAAMDGGWQDIARGPPDDRLVSIPLICRPYVELRTGDSPASLCADQGGTGKW